MESVLGELPHSTFGQTHTSYDQHLPHRISSPFVKYTVDIDSYTTLVPRTILKDAGILGAKEALDMYLCLCILVSTGLEF